MTPFPSRRSRLGTAALALLTITLVPGLAQLPAFAGSPTTAAPRSPDSITTLADAVAGLSNLDTRGTALPSAAQRQAVAGLGALDVRWNRFGTPASLLPADGSLATATSKDPVDAARAWLSRNAAIFAMTPGQVADLELVQSQKFAGSPARAVLFRQKFGNLRPALASMVTVGVANGEIAYASSSISKTTGAIAAATLTPRAAWLKAAANVGRTIGATDLAKIQVSTRDGWTRLSVPGFAQEQQTRLRSLAMADGTVRPVFESNVVDVQGGSAFAYTLMVDAVTGSILHRENQVEHNNDAFQFQGTITLTECGPKHQFELTDGATKQIVAQSIALPTDDHVVKIFDPNNQLLVSGDLGTSPETATYSAESIPAGIYSAQVCPYPSPTVPVVVGPYTLLVTTSDSSTPGPGDAGFSPRWKFFPSNPTPNFSTTNTPANSVIGCWLAGTGCSLKSGPFRNVAAPGPWDTFTAGGASTLTTLGNNANTREAWVSPLTPGGSMQAPSSPTREYTSEFTDAWNNSGCSQENFVPAGNDIDASVGNLFVNHNRMHDYSYYLGFTEENYNLQSDNQGRGGVGGDPEVGNAQAGAITGGAPSYQGRDNANQITLQDGTPGITNQYLFQPIAGAFYAPCTDGGFDMSIVGHEYTHAISNRMVGGPDEGLTSEQGGAMGESWGDLVAAEYMFSHDYNPGGSPWAVGIYATGNKKAGIRDYPINKNPLNYSDYGFDSTGDEVHADGEIWNGTQWQVRQALVKKWNRQFPYTDKALQLKCAQATSISTPRPVEFCPGNRRWVQLMFDAFLLQQGATSMLDARDAMLAADKMRFGGGDLKVMWDAFAKRGMGKGATTPNADSGSPKASFASPRSRNAKVTFKGKGGASWVYVGKYEARVTPVADTTKRTKRPNSLRLVPGKHQFLVVGKKRGFQRITVKLKPGQRKVVRIKGHRNLAAAKGGAKVIASSPGSLNAKWLIDGTERTNWAGITDDNVDATHPFVTVDLIGGVHKIRKVQVSAMLNPAPGDDLPVNFAADPDPDSGSRFTALRRFALEACVKKCSSSSAKWKRFYTSRANAFPALRPRPVAPNLILRAFRVKPTRAAAIRFVALENQCTGYAGYAGEQDNDPSNDTDCKTASDRGTIVHAAEMQVY